MALEGDAVTTGVIVDEPGLSGPRVKRESNAVSLVEQLTEMGSEL